MSGIKNYKLVSENPRRIKNQTQNTKEDIFPDKDNPKVSIKVNRNDK